MRAKNCIFTVMAVVALSSSLLGSMPMDKTGHIEKAEVKEVCIISDELLVATGKRDEVILSMNERASMEAEEPANTVRRKSSNPNAFEPLDPADIIPTKTSVYVPTATINTYIDDNGLLVSVTRFKNGTTCNYDIDTYIETVSDEEFLYRLVESEVGNQSDLAKRLVCDCVLNMKDSPKYPNSIKEVILNDGSFEVVPKGMIFRADVTESTKTCVNTELEDRIDYEVMYFRSGHYHGFGSPFEHVGDVWFSKP